MDSKTMIAAALLTTAAACSPVYRTTYRYQPPDAESARTCIFQCENTRLQCAQFEEMKLQNCEMRAEAEVRECKKENPKGYCSKNRCQIDETKCTQQYNACYQMCGGKVDADTQCVQNCK